MNSNDCYSTEKTSRSYVRRTDVQANLQDSWLVLCSALAQCRTCAVQTCKPTGKMNGLCCVVHSHNVLVVSQAVTRIPEHMAIIMLYDP